METLIESMHNIHSNFIIIASVEDKKNAIHS